MKSPHVDTKHAAPSHKKESHHATKRDAHAFEVQLAHAVQHPAPVVSAAHVTPAPAPLPKTDKPHHHKHHVADKEVAAAARPAPTTERPQVESSVRAPLSESSSRPAPNFSVEAPRLADVKDGPAPLAPPPPSWLPVEAALDDTARLAVFPHAMQWVTDNGTLNVQVRGNEVMLRMQGELAASLKESESELRVALAQRGLELHEMKENDDGHHEHH